MLSTSKKHFRICRAHIDDQQQFVLHVCEDYTYVNREEDTGDPGLRKAKMSYYPEILLKKYVAISSDVIFADKDRNREEIHKIWETCLVTRRNW
mgnify:CR=1 FL=1